MKIRVLKLGHSASVIEADDGVTVEDAISAAGHDHHGYSLNLNGLGTAPDAVLSDGDVVVVSPKVQGGQ